MGKETQENRVIYLDNNATTCVAREVLEALMPYLTNLYGNPSSIHSFGGQVKKAVDDARESVALILGAEHPDEIIFTSCGSESDNTAIRSALASNPARRKVVTTRVEHPAVLTLCQRLERDGYTVSRVGVNAEGSLDLGELAQAITDDTAVVSVMHANNETGVIFPIREIGRMAHERGALFHTDAVQSVGKIPIDVSENFIDFLSLSGHKLHAPKGVGALYVKRGTRFQPFLLGGHQERGRRGGTENVAGIAAFGKAAELARKNLPKEQNQVRALRDRLESGIQRTVKNVKLNGHREARLPNTTNLSFEFVEGEAILLLLDQLGICASSGSACTSGSLDPSHVLRAMGVPFTFAHGSVRFSLSVYNTGEEIDFVLGHLPGIIGRLREISPFYTEKGVERQDAHAFGTACKIKSCTP